VSERVDELLKQLDLDEKISLVSGADMWRTPTVPRLGIPQLKLTDGPSGARGGGVSGDETSASFPCGSALAATWNAPLLERLGDALAQEARSKGCHVLLGPTVNLHRHPLGGRHFECYSEDPVLSAEIAVALIKGLQAGGVGGCAKHYVGNDSEFERHTIDSEIGERPLRELYLLPFEHAVKRAEVWSVMSAYNRTRGTFMSAHDRLLNGVLKGEWGFDGFVVSDWFGTQGTVASATGGLDLEMPGPPRVWGEKLRAAVDAGDVEEGAIDEMVRRMLRAMLRTGAFEGVGSPEPPELSVDLPEHRALARRLASEAIVLAKNEAEALPLRTEGEGAIRSLAVIGPAARYTAVQGGGSARVSPHYQISALDGIRGRAGAGVEVHFAPGCTNHRRLPALGGPLLEGKAKVTFRNGDGFGGEPALERSSGQLEFNWLGKFAAPVEPRAFTARIETGFVPDESGDWQLSLTSAGTSRLFLDGAEIVDNWTKQERGDTFFGAGSTEVRATIPLEAGRSYALRVDFAKTEAQFLGGLRVGCLPPVPDDAIERAVALASRCDAAVVVIGSNADWETEGRDRTDLGLPGRQAELVSRVAAANRRAVVVLNVGAPVELPWLDEVPALLIAWYAGQESGNALADVLFGDVSPSGRLPTSWPQRLEDCPAFFNYPGESGQVLYGEGLFMGYRGYDARCVEPLLPFGHGLSYGRFAYANPRATVREGAGGEDGGDVSVSFSVDLTNGGAAAFEVVQLYVADPVATLTRPEQELRAFTKIALGPGETRTVTLELGAEAFAFWDPERERWVTEAGEFELRCGGSSRAIAASTTITVLREHLASAARVLRD
jgi:beta-glucosidase